MLGTQREPPRPAESEPKTPTAPVEGNSAVNPVARPGLAHAGAIEIPSPSRQRHRSGGELGSWGLLSPAHLSPHQSENKGPPPPEPEGPSGP